MPLRPIANPILLAAVAVTIAVAVWFGATSYAKREALARVEVEAETLARQHSRLIDSELARFRLLPIVLGEYGDLAAALSASFSPVSSRFSKKLSFLAQETGASVLYVLAPSGRVVASSNADRADSFMGENFGFRPYFKLAMREGSAEYYGAGSVTKRLGLFLSRRIGSREAPAGIVVVKYEFDPLSRIWASDPGDTLIVDRHGIILAASDPAQLLTSLSPLPAETVREITSSGRYGDAGPRSGLYEIDGSGMVATRDGRTMARADLPIAGTDLTLLHLMDTAPALRQAGYRAWLLTSQALLLFGALGAAFWWRITRVSRAAADRRALEVAVSDRTLQLREEMVQRERADRRFREAREELAQANRLASLGSITAGLMHEINQPVATIRTLSENARHHLAANRPERVKANLDVTIEMAQRIGTITQEMRRFSRRRQGSIRPESLDGVIEGTMLLMQDRLRTSKVRLDLPPAGQPNVQADRVRLEQVLVNLLQNALDAVGDIAHPCIALVASCTQTHLALSVSDNGPGIDADIGQEIFMPFVTGKPDGLGLGLGIAQEIMRDLGGSLAIGEPVLGGATFIVTVRLA